jgi:predicted type IV restriction endonuclease
LMTDPNTPEVSPADASPKDTSARKTPKWEASARERLKTAIRRYSKPLAEMAERDANEGDTRLLVTDFLSDGLGYDKFDDLTTEYQVKGEFADYGIRIDKELVAFVEVKRITTKLAQKHLRQVQNYALNEGVEWVLLTNGARWQAYHITAGLPVQTDLALDVDLLGSGSSTQKVNQLFYLTRESLRKRQIDELWKARRATAPRSLAEVLVSEPVIEAVRKELRRKTGHRIEQAEVARLLQETVIRNECLEG